MKPIQRILIATDFSPCAHTAADMAERVSRPLSAIVHVMTMVDTSSVLDAPGDPASRRHRIGEMREQARQRLQTFADQHFDEIEDVQLHVVDGGADPDAAAAIARAGQEHACDLIVMGTHGKTGLKHLVLGSVAEKVVRTSTIPVLTVRRT
jgi:nucleotide-binding universal stress UspA family protein